MAGQFQAAGGPPHTNRSDDQNQGGDDRESAPAQRVHIVECDVGREQHEEHADQQDRELVLELTQLVSHPGVEIAGHHTGHRDRHQAARLHDGVAGFEQQYDAGQGKDIFVVARDQHAIPQRASQREPCRQTRDDPEANTDDDPERFRCECGQPRRDDQLQEEASEQRADRVDEHPFGLQNRLDPRAQSHVPQQRLNHRGAGHHDECPEERRQLDAPAEQERGQQRGAGPRDQRTHADQPPDRCFLALEARPLQVESALEQNDGDAEIDNAEQALAE